MIEERAVILDTGYAMAGNLHPVAKVRVQRTSACDACSMKSGCGQSALSKLSANHCLELDVDNNLGAKPGDEVLIAIPEQGLMSASLHVYFLPLLLMVVCALAGDFLFSGSEIEVILCACFGLILGFAWARIYSQKHAFHEHFLPRMTRILVTKAVHSEHPATDQASQ